MNSKKSFSVNPLKASAYAAVCASVLAFSSSAVARTELSMGHVLSPESHYGVGVTAFKEKLEDLSDGEFHVKTYHNAALGGERDLVEGIQFGTVDISLVTTSPAANFIPELYVLDLPYLFDNYEQAHCVLDGATGQELLGKIKDSGTGIVGLAWAENGFRHLTNSVKEIRKPSDLDGLTIRTLESKYNMAALDAMGARATPIAWPELFTALQQNAVDGQENGLATIIPSNLWEIQPHISKTGHLYAAAAILVSENLYQDLTEEQQSWFRSAAIAAREAVRAKVQDFEEMAPEFFENNGVEYIENPNRDAFKQKSRTVHEQYATEFGGEFLAELKTAAQGCSQ
jgi:TRAP-type transport system periplasmic protein